MDPKVLVFLVDSKCDLPCISSPSFSLHNRPKFSLFKVCLSTDLEQHMSFLKLMELVIVVIGLIAIMILS